MAGLTSNGGKDTMGIAMTIRTAEPERVKVGWRIRLDLKRWLAIEAAQRQLAPSRVVEELIEAMQEHADAKP